jgi:integrase
VRSRPSLVHGKPLALSDPAPTSVAGLGRQRSSSPTQLDSPRRFPSSHPLSASIVFPRTGSTTTAATASRGRPRIEALLLIRSTECVSASGVDLSLDCLRQVSQDQWALHVPLGKLHTERQVPVDEATRRILDRILSLRALFRPSRPEKPPGYLLPRRGRCRQAWIAILRKTLANAARTAVCTTSVTPHRLRHTFRQTFFRNQE